MHDTEYRLTRPSVNGKREIWYAVWQEGGRSYRASSGQRDKVAAQEWLELFKDAQRTPIEAATIGGIYHAYLKAIRPKQGEVSRTPLMAHFARKRPSILRQSDIREYIEKRSQAVSEATYATELRYLRAALNWAHREGYIEATRPFKIPAGRAVRYRFYTEQEFAAMVDGCETLRMRLFLEIALATASRPAKIYALKWSDIDTHSKTIYFATGNKTKRTRPVTINNRLSWVLGVAYQARLSDNVIERDGKPIKSLAKQFRELVSRLDIKDAKLRDLRGTAASWALQRGASIEKVADLLGDSVDVVQRHYGHFSPSHISSVTDLLG